jgi:hypothetical protein
MMSIEFIFDTELENTLLATFNNGWTWANYLHAIDAINVYPPNITIPDGVRVDLISDWRNTTTIPSDGVALVNMKKGRSKMIGSTKNIPRNGGLAVNIGNPDFIFPMLSTFGMKLDYEDIRKRLVPTLEQARQLIREHRRLF